MFWVHMRPGSRTKEAKERKKKHWPERSRGRWRKRSRSRRSRCRTPSPRSPSARHTTAGSDTPAWFRARLPLSRSWWTHAWAMRGNGNTHTRALTHTGTQEDHHTGMCTHVCDYVTRRTSQGLGGNKRWRRVHFRVHTCLHANRQY